MFTVDSVRALLTFHYLWPIRHWGGMPLAPK